MIVAKGSGLNKIRKLTQDFCSRLDDLKRRIVPLRNDLRSFKLGQKGKLSSGSYLILSPKVLKKNTIFLASLFLIASSSLFANNKDNLLSDYLRSTILESRNVFSNDIEKEDFSNNFKGLDAWVEDAEFELKNNGLNNFDDQQLSVELSLKNRKQLRTEQEILNLGEEKLGIAFSSYLESKLQQKYLSIIGLIEQKMRSSLLQLQYSTKRAEVNNWKAGLLTDNFKPDKLLQADLSLDVILAEKSDNLVALKRYQQGVSSGLRHNNKRENFYKILTVPQMLKNMQQIIASDSYKRFNPSIRKAKQELDLARKELRRSNAKENLAVSSVKLQYDQKDDDFSVSVGIRIPLTKNTFDGSLKKQELYLSNLEKRNTNLEIADQLNNKQFAFLRLQDEWLSNKQMLSKLNKRVVRITQTGNSQLNLDLKSERLSYQKRNNEINVRALKLYIEFLSQAGMLAATPYRNWLLVGTPAIL